MKHLKISSLFLLGLLSTFILTGCVGESGSGSSSSGNPNNLNLNNGAEFSNNVKLPKPKTIANTLHSALKNTVPMLTSFTLWTKQGDPTTAIAGQIIGTHVTIQVPYDTDFSQPFVVTFKIPNGYSLIRQGDELPLYSGASEYFSDKAAYTYSVFNPEGSSDYTFSIERRDKYFKPYGQSAGCLQDSDGNVWYKYMDLKTDITWDIANQDTKSLNGKSGPFNQGTCGLKTGWGLPSLPQMQNMLNYVPLASRGNPLTGVDEAQWFNEQGFMISSGVVWGGEIDSSTAYAWNILGLYAILSATPASKSIKQFSAWAVNSGDVSKAKRIYDFTFTTESGISVKGIITGNQIIVNIPAGINPGPEIKGAITASSTGSGVSVNGVAVMTGNQISYGPEPIPITVTAVNSDTNIYTLIVNFITPPPLTNIFICTSALSLNIPESSPNRAVFATINNKIYKNILPDPGNCLRANLGNTYLQDLKAGHPILWWSVDFPKPLALTSYNDLLNSYRLPKFKLTSSDTYSRYSLSAVTDPGCYFMDSIGFSASCAN